METEQKIGLVAGIKAFSEEYWSILAVFATTMLHIWVILPPVVIISGFPVFVVLQVVLMFGPALGLWWSWRIAPPETKVPFSMRRLLAFAFMLNICSMIVAGAVRGYLEGGWPLAVPLTAGIVLILVAFDRAIAFLHCTDRLAFQRRSSPPAGIR